MDGLRAAIVIVAFMVVGGVVVAVVVVAAGGIHWTLWRSADIARRWADGNGYELMESQRRLLRRGPFWWRTSSGQEVFRIVVRDGEGQVRRGYLRVGGWFSGLYSGKAVVRWDDGE